MTNHERLMVAAFFVAIGLLTAASASLMLWTNGDRHTVFSLVAASYCATGIAGALYWTTRV